MEDNLSRIARIVVNSYLHLSLLLNVGVIIVVHMCFGIKW